MFVEPKCISANLFLFDYIFISFHLFTYLLFLLGGGGGWYA